MSKFKVGDYVVLGSDPKVIWHIFNVEGSELSIETHLGGTLGEDPQEVLETGVRFPTKNEVLSIAATRAHEIIDEAEERLVSVVNAAKQILKHKKVIADEAKTKAKGKSKRRG